ncbi:hypothetical protein N0V95_004399 [Ascochyta clinopodiicola]|nr:hypothetical protein N0V95_004399 [Ascochyta clinopodiicola]
MYSKEFEKLIYDYFAFVTNLPLREAFAPPVFDHYTVLETWKEAFAGVLARCKDEDVASLTRSATKTEIGNLVKHRVAKSSWHVVLKACSHTPGIKEMCPRCEKELGIARQAIIEQANLSAQVVLGTDSDDYIHAQIWTCIAENALC